MFRALLVLLISFPAYAGDFRPHVLIVNKGESQSIFSGTIFRKTKTHNYILTCAHGVQGIDRSDLNLNVKYYNDEYSISTEASLEASDEDLDLAIIKTPNYTTIRVWPVQTSDMAPLGAACIISGYASGTYSVRSVRVNSYKMAYRTSGKEFLVCDGKVEGGMSGCGLIYDGKIIGVLSSDVGKIGPPSIFVTDGGMYVTGEQIATFLKENDHD